MDLMPTVAMLETAALVDALSAQQAKASRPVAADALGVLIELVYEHQATAPGYWPGICRGCGQHHPCPDYQRVRGLVEGWGLL